jgi:hypothetical protein
MHLHLNFYFEPLRLYEGVKNMKISFALSLKIRIFYLNYTLFLNSFLMV